MSDDIVARAHAALEGVTAGPWQWERNTLTGGQGAYDEVLAPGPVECMSYCYGGTSVIEGDNPEPDRRFIAASRTLMPELVAKVESLEAEVERLRAAARDVETASAAARPRERRCPCGHRIVDHNGNYSGSRACDQCACPAYPGGAR